MKNVHKTTAGAAADGYINIPVSKATRDGLHALKESMGASNQAEVVAKLVTIALAIQEAAK